MNKFGKAASVAAAVAFSGALCYLALRGVRLRSMVQLVSSIQWLWFPVLIIIPVLDLFIRAVRWRLLVAPVAKASAWKFFQWEAVGLAINNILFLRLGEVARGYVTARDLKIATVTVWSTIIVERLCDTAALLTLFSVYALMLPDVIPARLQIVSAGLACSLVAALAVAAVADAHIKEEKAWLRRLKEYPRAQRLATEIMLGARALSSTNAAMKIALLSLGLWICDAGVFWAASRALRFVPPLGYGQSVAVVAGAAVASIVPAVPGAFGNFEVAVKYILTHFGYGADLSVGYAALVHLIMYLVVTSLGILFLHRLGYTFAGLRRALEKR